MRLLLIIDSNDPQVWFDWIVLCVKSLVLQQIGLIQEAAFSMTDTLQSASPDINTAFWLSIEKYFPTKPLLQGSGQGNDTGPTIWVMISDILLTNMHDQGFELETVSCLSQLVLVIAGFALFDNNDIINVESSVNIRGEDLLAQQQQMVDT